LADFVDPIVILIFAEKIELWQERHMYLVTLLTIIGSANLDGFSRYSIYSEPIISFLGKINLSVISAIV
jgi:hypothetical protein